MLVSLSSYSQFTKGQAPSRVFDRLIETLNRRGVQVTRAAIADDDREHGYNPFSHPRGYEV